MVKKTFISFKVLILKIFYFKRKKEEELDKNLVYSLSASNIPNKKQLKHVGKLLSKREKIIIILAGFLLLANLIYLGGVFYNRYWQAFPSRGGTYTEGVLGLPRLINPLYAIDRDVDADLAYLIYSSLFTYDNQGQLVGDLVVNWEISEDKLEYIFNLREGVKWHEGGQLTADDVLFTFYLMKNPEFRSPWRRNLVGIELEKIDDFTIKFILQEPYAPLFELLTFGILPGFAWEATNPDFILLSDLNLKPIGSGPFKFKSLTKNSAGEIKDYRLAVNADYYGRQPYLEEIVFKFYFDFVQLVQALNNQEVDGIAYLPPELKTDILAKNSFSFNSLARPQINALFFNQANNQALADKNIRQALAISLDRDNLIDQVLFGLADRSDGPLPISNFAYNHQLSPLPYNLEAAEKLLIDSGWQKVFWLDLDDEEDEKLKKLILDFSQEQELDISKAWLVDKENDKFLVIELSVPESRKNLSLAEMIKDSWQELGIITVIKDLNHEQIQTEIIKDGNFEILLQKQVVGVDPDVSAFWHSTQRESGLNLINYNNKEVDSLLSKGRQLASSLEERIEVYHTFQELLVEDLPAIFLFSSKYLYIQDKKLKGFSTQVIIEPRYRFSSINDCYLRTKQRFVK